MFINKILEIVAEHLGFNEVKTTDSLVDDLAADSLDVVELVMLLEEEFNINIDDNTMEHTTTVQDFINVVHDIVSGDTSQGEDLLRNPYA